MPSGGQGPSFAGVDPFLSGVAGDVLRQQGQSYLQRSQAYMQSKIGFLSGGTISYLFAVTPEYGACVLMYCSTCIRLLPLLIIACSGPKDNDASPSVSAKVDIF